MGTFQNATFTCVTTSDLAVANGHRSLRLLAMAFLYTCSDTLTEDADQTDETVESVQNGHLQFPHVD